MVLTLISLSISLSLSLSISISISRPLSSPRSPCPPLLPLPPPPGGLFIIFWAEGHDAGVEGLDVCFRAYVLLVCVGLTWPFCSFDEWTVWLTLILLVRVSVRSVNVCID